VIPYLLLVRKLDHGPRLGDERLWWAVARWSGRRDLAGRRVIDATDRVTFFLTHPDALAYAAKLADKAHALTGKGCECSPVPEYLWTTHYGAVDPVTTIEYEPSCPVHGRMS
jgi:hypothetical protein